MILIPSSLLSLLSQLTTPQGVPHTAILTSSSSGSIISSHSVPVQDPLFPKATYQDDEGLADEERVGMYAALAVGTWNEQRGTGTSNGRDPLMLETEVGRIAVISIASFLLILIGTDVTPWKVLDKKIRAAEAQLREPLAKVST